MINITQFRQAQQTIDDFYSQEFEKAQSKVEQVEKALQDYTNKTSSIIIPHIDSYGVLSIEVYESEVDQNFLDLLSEDLNVQIILQ